VFLLIRRAHSDRPRHHRPMYHRGPSPSAFRLVRYE
jgi:hypothetical protein